MMKRVLGILVLVLAVSLLSGSDVQGFGLTGAGKTTGPSLTATVVIDVTPSGINKGQTSVRVQRASTSAAVLFTSSLISGIPQTCVDNNAAQFPAITNAFFAICPFPGGGCLVSSWIDDPLVRQALLGPFTLTPDKAAITDTDYAVCTSENGRQILSFTAVIQFQP
jgi:hypothetical protein